MQVVHLYYQRHLTQKEIAQHFGVSKMTISRALKRAEEEGLIEIRLHLPISNDIHLERELAECLKLSAFVVRVPEGDDFEDEALLLDFLGRGTAFYIDPLLQNSTIIGVALGRTVARVVHHVRSRKLLHGKVVQIMGGLDITSSQNPYNLIQALSQRLGAEGSYFSGPAFVANKAVQQAMLEQNTQSGLKDLWNKCEFCLLGIGAAAANNPYVKSGFISPEEQNIVLAKGAVGDILGNYYDVHGQLVFTELNSRVNAMPFEDLRQAKWLIVTAGGTDKVEPIIGAAKLQLPITLITDHYTARQVISTIDVER